MSMYHLDREDRNGQMNFQPGEFIFIHSWDMPAGKVVDVHHHDWHEFVWNCPSTDMGQDLRPHELIFDGGVYSYGGGELLYLPPFHDHGFRTAPGLRILILGIDEGSLRQLLGRSQLGIALSDMLAAWQDLGPRVDPGNCFLETLLADPEASSLAGKFRILLELERIQKRLSRRPRHSKEPRERSREAMNSPKEVLVRRALAYLEANFREGPDVTTCAEALSTGRSTLSRRFSACMGVSIPVYVQRIRVRHAMTLLNQSSLGTLDIALECGFSDASHFARTFRNHCGLSPSEWRRPGTA
jgi:AraC-like DNA-binding protein